MTEPTKQEVKDVLEEVEALDLPDGAYWAMCADRLGLDQEGVMAYVFEDPEFYGYEETN